MILILILTGMIFSPLHFATAKYRLNPQSVGMDCADFSFVGDKADYIFTRGGGADAPISIVGKPVDKNGGSCIYSEEKQETQPGTGSRSK